MNNNILSFVDIKSPSINLTAALSSNSIKYLLHCNILTL